MGGALNAKLTLDHVRAIRASTELTKVLAERYGVTESAICRIRSNIAWRDGNYMPRPRASRKLTWDQVIAIRAATPRQQNLAAIYGVSPSTITSVRSGRAYKRP